MQFQIEMDNFLGLSNSTNFYIASDSLLLNDNKNIIKDTFSGK
jgi:hypothetical protein